MAERENSVLFSLKELRNIEEDRVKQEEHARQAAIEAERRAKEEAIRRAKEEDEQRAIAERDRLARLEQEKERQMREERLRVEESERRARVEAAARLEEARIHAEVQAKAQMKKAPVGAIVGAVVAVVVLAGGALGYVLGVYVPAQREEQARIAAAEQERAIKKAVQDAKDQLSMEYDTKINNAKDEAERARLKAEKIARQQAAEEAVRKQVKRPSGPSKAAAVKPAGAVSDKCKNSDDPLCGAGL